MSITRLPGAGLAQGQILRLSLLHNHVFLFPNRIYIRDPVARKTLSVIPPPS